MEELYININWIAVIVGAILAYALGALWYSPKMFGTKWLEGVGVPADDTTPMMPAMVTQALGTFLLAWMIGVTETTESLGLAILVGLTLATLIKANGLFVMKSKYAIITEAGFILAMVALMILTHAIL